MTPTIVTTCMGRLDFLKQALPTWLRHTMFDVLVVDYACPDGTAAWIEGLRDPRVEALRVACDLTTYTRPIFNKPRALNIALDRLWTRGHSLAEPGGSVLLLDADTLLLKTLLLDVQPGELWLIEPSPDTRDLSGVLGADVDQLLACGGFDEEMVGWGAEDLDLRVRLYLHTKPGIWLLPSRTFGALPHTDELRGRLYPDQDLDRSAKKNLERLFQKLSATSYHELEESGAARILLGAGAER